jgi:hypothetical protein
LYDQPFAREPVEVRRRDRPAEGARRAEADVVGQHERARSARPRGADRGAGNAGRESRYVVPMLPVNAGRGAGSAGPCGGVAAAASSAAAQPNTAKNN